MFDLLDRESGLMDGIDFLLVSGLFVGVICLLSGLFTAREAPLDESEPPPARWRRHLVDPLALQEGGESRVITREDSTGREHVVLSVLAGSAERMPLRLTLDGRETSVRFERPRVSLRPNVRVRIGGTPWIKLKDLDAAEFPSMLPAENEVPDELPRVEDLRLVGDLDSREYEVRWRGRLVASVSWQRDDPNSPASHGLYAVEILRSASQLPILALCLALEVAETIDGRPLEPQTARREKLSGLSSSPR